MSLESESALIVYRDEIQQVTAGLGDAPLEAIVERGVRWQCRTAIETDDFASRICHGVGYYTLVRNIGEATPAQPSCNAGPEEPEVIDLRESLSEKRQALMNDMPELVTGMDTDGPILEAVDGLTGRPPSWGNVLRITATQLWREPRIELTKPTHVPGAVLSPAAAERLRQKLSDISASERLWSQGSWRHYPH